MNPLRHNEAISHMNPVEGATRVARGYSRFVHIAKRLLPVAALLLVVLVLVWPHLRVSDLRFRIGFSSIETGEDGDPNMVNPRFIGTDRDRQIYSITADLAKNLMRDTETVELEMPKADIALKDGTWLVLTAETGIYSRKGQTLDLTGSVNLFHDSGYEFRTEKSSINLSDGSAWGTVPVEGQGPFGNLKGEGFHLTDKGRTIVFTGKSKLLIYPGLNLKKEAPGKG